MAIYGAGYSTSASNRSQSAGSGGGATTSLSVNEYARLNTGTGQAGTMSASDPANFSASYTLRRNGSNIGSATFTAGGSSAQMTVSSQVFLQPGDTLQIVAPGGSPFPGGTTVSATWLFRTLTWVQVPQLANRLYGNQGGSWQSLTEVWGAEPIGANTFQWTRVWQVIPPPPPGVTITNIEQEFFFGGGVNVSWTNAPNTTGTGYDLQPEINSVQDTIISGATTGSNNTQTVLIPENRFSSGDSVRARMRYTSGGVNGDWGPWSSTITYFS